VDPKSISYYSAPKNKPRLNSLEDADPELLRTFEKLGIPLKEQEILLNVRGAAEANENAPMAARANVAVDAVFDSVSVATTFKEALAKEGIIFCSISEAIREHPDLVREYLGSVVPYSDNYYATLNSAVFSDGSFVYVPKGVRCPMELSTYFRINAKNTGQFERTLIIADEGAYVSYLEGCTAPMRDENQLHAAASSSSRSRTRPSSTAPSKTGIPATRRPARAASSTSSPSAASAKATTPRSPGPRSRPAARSRGSTRASSCAAITRSASSTASPSPRTSSRRTPGPR